MRCVCHERAFGSELHYVFISQWQRVVQLSDMTQILTGARVFPPEVFYRKISLYIIVIFSVAAVVIVVSEVVGCHYVMSLAAECMLVAQLSSR